MLIEALFHGSVSIKRIFLFMSPTMKWRYIIMFPEKFQGEHIVAGLSVCPFVCCPEFVSRPLLCYGRYLEGQGHSMTLQRNRVRPITE